MSMSYEEFYERWNNASTTSDQKKPQWKIYVPNPKKLYQEFPKFKARMKYANLYRMYCETNDMKMAAFRRCVEYFIEAQDFRNWRERMRWIGEHYSDKAVTLAKMTAYYGEVEGNIRWKTYCDKQSETNTFEYKHKKYGMTEEEFKAYNQSRAVTLKNCIKKHGEEEGTRIFKEYCIKQKDAGCSLSYFQEKYGEIEGKKKYLELNAQKVQTLENYIRKYGYEEGKIRYDEYLRTGCTYSKIAMDMFKAIVDKLPAYIKYNPIHFGGSDNYGEYVIVDKANYKTYLIDFTIPIIHYCIEFNGDYWHCNPKLYEEDETISFHGESFFVKDIWEKDERKIDFIRSQGFECDIIWENDYKKDPDKIISECVEKIKQKFKDLVNKE